MPERISSVGDVIIVAGFGVAIEVSDGIISDGTDIASLTIRPVVLDRVNKECFCS